MLLDIENTAEQVPMQEGCRSSGDAHICSRLCVLNNDVLHMGLKDVMCRTACLYSN